MELKILKDETAAYARIRELRSQFQPELFLRGPFSVPKGRQDVFRYAVGITWRILQQFSEMGFSLDKVDPGHGIGHWTRDFINAQVLLSALEFEPIHILVGMAGGTLHDLGATIVARYQESKTPLRHADVMGLALDQIFSGHDFGLTVAEQRLIQWAVMAHTHYLKPQTVSWRGTDVVIEPYPDMGRDGEPLWGIWITRWVDRLECSGSETFPARHWLTLFEEHEDFDGQAQKFFSTRFADDALPIVRMGGDSGKKTILGHLHALASSQTNASPYGLHDRGRMVELRDAKRERLLKFIHAVVESPKQFGAEDRIRISREWTSFLGNVIEPSDVGRKAAGQLEKMFLALDPRVQNAWCNGFEIAMRDYRAWGAEVLQILDRQGQGAELLNLPFLGDVRQLLSAAVGMPQ